MSAVRHSRADPAASAATTAADSRSINGSNSKAPLPAAATTAGSSKINTSSNGRAPPAAAAEETTAASSSNVPFTTAERAAHAEAIALATREADSSTLPPMPCLRCMKQLAKQPWLVCTRLPHANCHSCAMGKEACEQVPRRFRRHAQSVQRAALKTVKYQMIVCASPKKSRDRYHGDSRLSVWECRLRYRQAVFTRRVEAWVREEAALLPEEKLLRELSGIKRYLKELVAAGCTLARRQVPSDSEYEPIETLPITGDEA
ncbi:hypothetical protein GP486_008384 [Trichoglossum hirsutum]|uniref:Uncharacterized protein n=1 Tax=Trichoglossum hirsutum TaxID=265104 RepID=A0A9P8L461_9PEZI|nr:hypothetical protein GP486_008384 [Trichoglossum hirsutum]